MAADGLDGERTYAFESDGAARRQVLATGGSRDISGEFPEYGVSAGRTVVADHADVDHDGQHGGAADVSLDGAAACPTGGFCRPAAAAPAILFPTISYNAEILFARVSVQRRAATITAAPDTVQYNSSFFVRTPDAAGIASVSLIRNGSVTHAVNMDHGTCRLRSRRPPAD